MTDVVQVTSPDDGVVLVVDPDQTFRFWALDQIYLGNVGRGKYVGKVGDMVIDRTIPTVPVLYTITELNDLLVPTLRPVKWRLGDGTSEGDGGFELVGFVGVGPGQINNNVRVYIDKSTWPYTCQMDTRVGLPGSMNSYAKVFRGSVTSGHQECISRMYNASGELIGENVPMEPSYDFRRPNNVIRVLATFKTTHDIPDNELLTIVAYSDDGRVTFQEPAVAMNTAFIASVDRSLRYIKDISLVSPFINQNRPGRVEYPLNTPLEAANFQCRVEYNDGFALIPIDGTKAYLSGMDSFLATIIGQQIPDLTLHYRLGADEYNYTGGIANGQHISKGYNLVVIDNDPSVHVKIFVTFEWTQTNGYRIKYWLYHQLRQRYWDVTNLVEPGDGSMSYDPFGFGVVQRLVVTLELSRVDATLRKYRHVQTVTTVINPTTHHSPWVVHYLPGQSAPSGAGLYCEYRYLSSGYTEVKLNMHCTTIDEWLDKLYYQSRPLVDVMREGVPPKPNVFEVEVNGMVHRYRVLADWNKTVVFTQSLQNYNTMVIRFIEETADTDLQLSCTSVLMKDAATLPFMGDFALGG